MVHLTDPGPAPRPTLGRQLEDHFQGVLGPKDMASGGNMGVNNVDNDPANTLGAPPYFLECPKRGAVDNL